MGPADVATKMQPIQQFQEKEGAECQCQSAERYTAMEAAESCASMEAAERREDMESAERQAEREGLVAQLSTSFKQWIGGLKITTFVGLKDFMNQEQFLTLCPADTPCPEITEVGISVINAAHDTYLDKIHVQPVPAEGVIESDAFRINQVYSQMLTDFGLLDAVELGEFLLLQVVIQRLWGGDNVTKISPYIGKPFQTCAVVGNGGILLNSSCGDDIDKMDYVFRLNLPPLNVKDTGAKSDLVSANPSILIKKFQRLDERRKPFIDLVKHYGSAMILVPAFYNQLNTDLCFRVHQSLEDFNLPNKVAFFHPEYLRNLSAHWQKTGLSAKRMSSGLMLVSAAIELCKKVTLYGFWPFSQGPEGNIIPHHYYDNIKPRPGFHSMPDEFHLYTKMHLKGALYIKVGKC
ncbi:alpha-2,8-sialyltransferase 8E-like [Mixophyes fleayi]|uniref:alpha-2,8-sialyltransferase 8E-like n=1 Tax=Mixophyes fleayi TaxID=3061075 RepID=UPI003F4D71A3